jgi:hypothetical protein
MLISCSPTTQSNPKHGQISFLIFAFQNWPKCPSLTLNSILRIGLHVGGKEVTALHLQSRQKIA